MPFVSITRLRLRSAWYLLPFFIHAQRSSSQMVRNSRFIKAKTLLDKNLASWTMSLWHKEPDMRASRNADAHKKPLPNRHPCWDEAAVTHWQQEGEEFPAWTEAWQHMK